MEELELLPPLLHVISERTNECNISISIELEYEPMYL
jgi:hypothetical protein